MTKYVKYIGTSHWREISNKDWSRLDPPVDQRTLRWDVANGWTLPADLVTEHAWPYIEADSELVIVDKDYRNPDPGKSTEDSAPADPMYYPPLTTGAQAENIDSRSDVPYGVQPEVDEDRDPDDDWDDPDRESDEAMSEVDDPLDDINIPVAESDVAQNQLPDQESGSVGDIRYTGRKKRR